MDVQAARVGFVAILGIDQLANGLCHVFRMNPGVVRRRFDDELLLFRRLGLGGGDEAVFLHALNDVELPGPSTFRVVDRVEGRGRLGQAGQHGCFRNRDVLDGFSEIRFRGGSKTIRTVPKEDLVHVDLQDLILGQQMFQFEREQNFVNLPRVGFLR